MVHIELELAVVALERLHSISVYPSAILTKGGKKMVRCTFVFW